MKLTSTSFAEGQEIPGDFSFCIADPAHHVCLGNNFNPQLAWSDVPSGTRSFALICHDPDVPSQGDDVNQEGRTVPAALPRIDFFHWVLIDLPATTTVANPARRQRMPAARASTATPTGLPTTTTCPEIITATMALARRGMMNLCTATFSRSMR